MEKHLEIKLTQNKISIIDAEDLDKVMQIKWHYHNRGYAANKNKDKVLLLHRYILNIADKALIVDHINGDKLDNRKENLRVCNKAQNSRNQKRHKDSTNKYKGVWFHKINKKWCARICVNYKELYLGSFITENEAATAYNDAALRYHGEFALLNILK